MSVFVVRTEMTPTHSLSKILLFLKYLYQDIIIVGRLPPPALTTKLLGLSLGIQTYTCRVTLHFDDYKKQNKTEFLN